MNITRRWVRSLCILPTASRNDAPKRESWETTVRVRCRREVNEIISTTFLHVGVSREIFRMTARYGIGLLASVLVKQVVEEAKKPATMDHQLEEKLFFNSTPTYLPPSKKRRRLFRARVICVFWLALGGVAGKLNFSSEVLPCGTGDSRRVVCHR